MTNRVAFPKTRMIIPGIEMGELLEIAHRRFARLDQCALGATDKAAEFLLTDPRPLMYLSLEGTLLRDTLTRIQPPEGAPALASRFDGNALLFSLDEEVAAPPENKVGDIAAYPPGLFEFLEAVQWHESVQTDLLNAAQQAGHWAASQAQTRFGTKETSIGDTFPGAISGYMPADFIGLYLDLYQLWRTGKLAGKDSFMDLGCGIGTAVGLASGFFARAAGCEPNSVLASFGQRFLAERGPHLRGKSIEFGRQNFMDQDFVWGGIGVFYVNLGFSSLPELKAFTNRLIDRADEGSIVIFGDPAGAYSVPGLRQLDSDLTFVVDREFSLYGDSWDDM